MSKPVWVLTAFWVGLVLWHHYSGAESVSPAVGGLFLLSLGLSTIGWGWMGIRSGEILIKRRRARREESPILFWTIVIFFHFTLGAVLTVAGVFYLLRGQPT